MVSKTNNISLEYLVKIGGEITRNKEGIITAIKAPDNFLFKLSDQRIIILVNCADGKNEELGSVILSSCGLRLLFESGKSIRKMFLVAPLK